MKLALARRFFEAVSARDFDACGYLHPDVETVTPRGTLRGVAAWRVFIEKVDTGSEDLEVETTKFQLEEIEDDVLARARDIRRWRETGEIALEQDFAVRLTVEGDKIIRNVAMPGGAPGVGQS